MRHRQAEDVALRSRFEFAVGLRCDSAAGPQPRCPGHPLNLVANREDTRRSCRRKLSDVCSSRRWHLCVHGRGCRGWPRQCRRSVSVRGVCHCADWMCAHRVCSGHWLQSVSYQGAPSHTLTTRHGLLESTKRRTLLKYLFKGILTEFVVSLNKPFVLLTKLLPTLNYDPSILTTYLYYFTD